MSAQNASLKRLYCPRDAFLCLDTEDGPECPYCGWMATPRAAPIVKPVEVPPAATPKKEPLPASATPPKPARTPTPPSGTTTVRHEPLPAVVPVPQPSGQIHLTANRALAYGILLVGLGGAIYLARAPIAPSTQQVATRPATAPPPAGPPPTTAPAKERPAPDPLASPGSEPPLASPPSERRTVLTVITDPPGADITIDGQGHWTTPASIDLPMDSALHAVAVELEGYKNEFRRFRLEPGAQELAVTLARVPEAIQPVSDTMLPPHSITPPADPPVDRVIASPGEGGTTSVPPAAPPAPPVPVSAVPLSPPTLVLRAPFPVMLSFEGRVAPASATHTLRLTPGAQTIHVTAPQVFLRRALRFNASDGDVRHEQVPDAVYVQVASVPSNATLKINGWYAGTAPLTPQVVLGPNQFEFAWPGSARTHVVNVEITAAGQRIFGRTPQ